MDLCRKRQEILDQEERILTECSEEPGPILESELASNSFRDGKIDRNSIADTSSASLKGRDKEGSEFSPLNARNSFTFSSSLHSNSNDDDESEVSVGSLEGFGGGTGRGEEGGGIGVGRGEGEMGRGTGVVAGAGGDEGGVSVESPETGQNTSKTLQLPVERKHETTPKGNKTSSSRPPVTPGTAGAGTGQGSGVVVNGSKSKGSVSERVPTSPAPQLGIDLDVNVSVDGEDGIDVSAVTEPIRSSAGPKTTHTRKLSITMTTGPKSSTGSGSASVAGSGQGSGSGLRGGTPHKRNTGGNVQGSKK